MAVRGVINEFFNIDEFQKQLTAVTDGINKYIDLVKAAPAIRGGMSDPTKVKETVEGMKQLADQNTKVADTAAKVAEEQKKLADSIASLPKNLQENIAKQIEYKSRLNELGSSLKELKKQQDILSKTEGNDKAKKEITDRVQAYSEEQAKLKVLNVDLTRTINAQVKEGESAANSIDQAKAAVSRLTAERNKINVTTEEGRAKVDALNKAIDAQNDFLKVNASQLEKVKINIGNYEGSAAIIVEALKDVEKEITSLTAKQQGLVNLSKSNPIGFKLSGGADELNKVNAQLGFTIKQADTLGAITNNPKFLNIAANVGDTNKELRFFQQQLNTLEDAGLKNSQVYQDVQSRLAKLTDQLGDTRAEIKAMASDTRSFDLFAGSVSFAADAFQTFAGAAALAGVSEEDVARSTQTLVAIQSVANGVKGIANELTTKGTAANKAYNYVLAIGNTLFGKGTTAAQRFGAAIKGIGLILLVTVIIEVVQALGKFVDKADDAKKNLQKLNDEIERNKKLTQDLAGSDQFDFQKQIEGIKLAAAQRSKFAKTDLEQQKLDQETKKKLFDTEVKFRSEQLEKLQVQKENADEDLLHEEIRQNQIRLALQRQGVTTISKDRAEADKSAIDALKKNQEDVKKAIQQGQRDLVNFQGTNATSLVQDESDAAKAAAKLAKEKYDERIKLDFELGKISLQQQADFSKEIADDEKRSSEDRLFALQQYVLTRASIINAGANVEKKIGNKTAKEKILIDEQAADELLRLQREVAEQGSQILNKGVVEKGKITDSEKSHIDDIGQKTLDGFKDRTEKELAIAKGLLDQKKELRDQEKELYKSLYSELSGFAIEFFTSQQDREIARNEEESARIDEQKQKDIDTITQTVTDRAKAADEIRIIEAKAASDKAVLENKNREAEKKKQSIERLGKIAEIAGNTAQGVASLSVKSAEARALGSLLLSDPLTAAYAPVAFANAAIIAGQIPLVIGIGAAQIARLVLPKFKDGGITPGGPVIVGDGGRSEGVQLPDGTLLKTPSRSTVVDLPKGSQVFPDFKEMLLNSSVKEIPDVRVVIPYDKTERAIQRMEKSLVRTIKDKQENHWHMPGRYDMAMRDGSRFRAYLNENL